MSSVFRFETEGRIATLIMDRPLFGNAVNSELAFALADGWRQFEDDPGLDIAVITASGEKDFCLGADMYEMADFFAARGRGEVEGTNPIPGLGEIWQAYRAVTKPVICAVNGRCAGIGLTFLSESDIVLGSEKAAFSDPHVSWGGMSTSALARLLGRMPLDMINRMNLLGKGYWLDARRAFDIGLIGEIVPPGELMARAKAVAELAAATNQPAARAQKVAMRRALEAFMGPAVAAAREASGNFARATNQSEIAAGATSFAHDRPLSNAQRGSA
jgi:enoyl-CoA hydratase/carnithine racemase